jgi:hypothetical protein
MEKIGLFIGEGGNGMLTSHIEQGIVKMVEVK